MSRQSWRALLLAVLLSSTLLILNTCVGQGLASGSALYVQHLTSNPNNFNGQSIKVDGAYIWRPGDPALSVLALGVSTLDNGLDAQPLGDPIWLEGFPAEVTEHLHRPGDAVYGFVRVEGTFNHGGGFGPDGQFAHQITVTHAEPIERIRRIEQKIEDRALGEGKVNFFDLQRNPEAYDGQTVTTRGYYFWNSVIYVLAEGVSTEEDGASPQPIGSQIWMEGFPPDQSALLNVGPNNSYVWGEVEVTGTFQTGGGFGRDGAYESIFFVESATPLTP
ncbi:hypothetical protein [Candidatus Viridilinea mediisalina]|uniref:Uncharacterized protein n=1 Tax=Candidatus Viridilinea mediisalina TaxID=2024553 RepID=A0A2A6RHE7_9CHLR|nr:hypothetical protein [Candidatus Viridilinea mediisalina]PDW02544.1 hypothetical protein CJ255_13375 [Candidatus Viridilinea mediisalina]